MAWEDAGQIVKRLGEAAELYDRESSEAIAAEVMGRVWLTDAPFPTTEAKALLESLRSQRMFTTMRRVADALISTGQSAARIRRQYAQALIEEKAMSSAVLVLTALEADPATDRGEKAEALGLLGRVHKQLYVDSRGCSGKRARLLIERALEYYHRAYQENPRENFWHGVNCVALLHRAGHDGIVLDGYPEPTVLAEQILADIDTDHVKPADRRWGLASKAEACLAFGDARAGESLKWLAEYVDSPGVTAFELGSTHRQFVEVWQLGTGSDLGRQVLPVLRGKLLRLSGAELEMGAADLTAKTLEGVPPDAHYQKVLGDTDFVSLHRYRLGLERCRAVARVEKVNEPERGFGTGFVLRGSDLKGSLGGGLVFLTNAHVVSNNESVKGTLRPDKARISFKALDEAGAAARLAVKRVVWTSPPERLDATVLELDRQVPGVAPYPIATDLPLLDGSERVYIIGHPQGGVLSFSINDNRLLDYQDHLLHYRAPTEGGSSGSPVFNQDWDLIGIHHAGGKDMPRLNGKEGRYAANEGIWIQSIREALGSL